MPSPNDHTHVGQVWDETAQTPAVDQSVGLRIRLNQRGGTAVDADASSGRFTNALRAMGTLGVAVDAELIGVTTGLLSQPAGVGVQSVGVLRGIEGRTERDSGVYGESASSGETYGVRARHKSTEGAAVAGVATATTGQTYGVRGKSQSDGGVGVRGHTTDGDGETLEAGARGVTDSNRMFSPGIHGIATAERGAGVRGDAELVGIASGIGSDPDFGVWSEADTQGVLSYGGTGVWATGDDGNGVFGRSRSGDSGVFGQSFDGDGVRGQGTLGGFFTGTDGGVHGEGDAFGIAGESDNGVGVKGDGDEEGVRGEGADHGVIGVSETGSGVSGIAYDDEKQGVFGVSPAGTGDGVFGLSDDGRGVVGVKTDTGGYGVEGQASGGVGVRGVGAWGGIGDGQSVGLFGSGDGVGVWGWSEGGAGVKAESGTGYAIHSSGPCLFEGGDLRIRNGGLRVGGSKSFLQRVETADGTKEITYHSVEADRSLTEVSGVASLSDGRAEVSLPNHFELVTSDDEPLVVTVTPHGGTHGLKVVERSLDRFVVEELPAGGDGSYEFSYTVKGTRDGFEDETIVRDVSGTEPSPGSRSPTRPDDPATERSAEEFEELIAQFRSEDTESTASAGEEADTVLSRLETERSDPDLEDPREQLEDESPRRDQDVVERELNTRPESPGAPPDPDGKTPREIAQAFSAAGFEPGQGDGGSDTSGRESTASEQQALADRVATLEETVAELRDRLEGDDHA